MELVAARLLDPDVMFYRLSIFDDKAIEIFEKGIGRFYRFTDDERDTVSILNEMDLAEWIWRWSAKTMQVRT